MSSKFPLFLQKTFHPFNTKLGLGAIGMCKEYGTSKISELGKAKENVYYLKLQKKQLKILRNMLKQEEKLLSGKIKEQKRLLKQIEREEKYR